MTDDELNQAVPTEFRTEIDANANMSPAEKLFAKLFFHGNTLVKDMSLLETRAHIEELSRIALEAKAYTYAAREHEKKLKKEQNGGKPTGFERSVTVDAAASEAINVIKERQKRMTKAEKVAQSLLAAGISQEEVDKIMSAGNIKARLAFPTVEELEAAKPNSAKPKEEKPFVPTFNNPFRKS